MKIIFSKSFKRDYKKIKDKILKEKVDLTIEIFTKDFKDKRINYKHIVCKKDKYRYSIRVINSHYRILMTCIENICEFRFLVDHDEYDRKNKDC